ncbi:MAG: mechanosensitive ion channel family protein [Candidatus Eremiobacteraeota bacterium]|nr:mechanosensitive ion channel family protein [Candidatus Eremiobacteraeota bacterium]
MWIELLGAAGQSLLLLIGLTLIYRILFREEGRRTWARYIITRTKFWAYAAIFLIAILYFEELCTFLPFQKKLAGYVLPFVIAIIAILVVETLAAYIYDYLLIYRYHSSIPVLFRDIIRLGVYLVLIGFYFWAVLKINIAPIITTSAILSIIIGLAIQESLGNVFSGLALHLSHPFSLGDWVKVGEYEGSVQRIDWRATSIQTLSGDYIVIPNSSLAKLDLQNYSSPTSHHARIVEVGAHYQHSPDQVAEALLAAAASADGVLADPAPKVWVTRFGDSSITYNLKFWLDDFSAYNDIESRVMRQIWYHFKRAGIVIPFPIREVFHHGRKEAEAAETIGTDLLSSIDIFKSLSPEAIASLTRSLRSEIFPGGDVLFRQGDKGERFYIVKSGEVEVSVTNESGERLFTTALGPGSFFGEMSLLTGDARSATVVITREAELMSLGKKDLKELIARNPHMDEVICDAITDRQTRTAGSLSEADGAAFDWPEQSEEQLKLRNNLLTRIRQFFSY